MEKTQPFLGNKSWIWKLIGILPRPERRPQGQHQQPKYTLSHILPPPPILTSADTSEEAKQHSKEVLDQEFAGGNVETSGEKNPQNVAGGLKATVNNPKVSDEAKESAKERLKDMGQ
ncbi:MAG: hypothetical protein LQ343_006197 [Gyalolechia ehrenbergii]|nr:MAG: hypothetical protein LQ343_006197 [Gyalolechia ehrenbergii]